MDLKKLMRFAKGYNGLGVAVQAQVNSLVDGDTADINPNVILLAEERLQGIDDEFDAIVADFLDTENIL